MWHFIYKVVNKWLDRTYGKRALRKNCGCDRQNCYHKSAVKINWLELKRTNCTWESFEKKLIKLLYFVLLSTDCVAKSCNFLYISYWQLVFSPLINASISKIVISVTLSQIHPKVYLVPFISNRFKPKAKTYLITGIFKLFSLRARLTPPLSPKGQDLDSYLRASVKDISLRRR